MSNHDEPVAWDGYDLDAMVEAFQRVIEAHFNRKNPFHNPIDADAQMALRVLRGFIPYMKSYTRPQPALEPVATKHMMRWIEALKRLSDNGQHMTIPGLSSGACWELAIELEQFINARPQPAAQWVGLEATIPEGWRFYTADFSMQATGKHSFGSVMLIRDQKGVTEWHKLPDELKENDDGPPLYLSGKGKTMQEAIADASNRAIEAKLREKNA